MDDIADKEIDLSQQSLTWCLHSVEEINGRHKNAAGGHENSPSMSVILVAV
jgi:hypothetical protein